MGWPGGRWCDGGGGRVGRGGGVAIVLGWVVVDVGGVRVDVRRRRLCCIQWLVCSVRLLRRGAGVGGWGWRSGGSRIGMSSVGIGRMWVMWEAGVPVSVSHREG